MKTNKNSFDNKLLIPVKNRYFIDSKFNLSSTARIFNFLRKNKSDVIFSHLFFSNTLIRIASLFLLNKPKLVIYEHNNYEKEKSKKHFLIDKILSFFTFKIIAVSENVRKHLMNVGINPSKIVLLKNGIDFSFVDKKLDVELKRKSLGLGKNDKVIVSVGNVSFQKGYDILIEAARKTLLINNDAKFLICGSNTGKIFDELSLKISEYGLEKKIMFLGSRSDVLEILRISDVFCMPSRWEGLSIALLEAMASKRAIIVSNIESMKLILKDKEDCLMFKSEDVDDLVEKLVKPANNKELQNNLGSAALEKSRKYNIENNVESLLNIVNE